jgi:hypothetical protein
MAFIPNPNNYNFVDHKDKNRNNDHVSNLRWVSYEINNRYASAKPIIQMTTDGEFIQRWECIGDIVKELGFGNGAIQKACKNEEDHTYRGFAWIYTQYILPEM